MKLSLFLFLFLSTPQPQPPAPPSRYSRHKSGAEYICDRTPLDLEGEMQDCDGKRLSMQ